jgi:hypothetical protein
MSDIVVGDKFREKSSIIGNMSLNFEVRQTVDGLYVIRTWNKRKRRYDYSVENHRYFSADNAMRLSRGTGN